MGTEVVTKTVLPKIKLESSLEEFEARLAEAIDSELHRWTHRLCVDELRVFDLGCFPWHAYLELSFLTTREDETTTKHPEGIAGWRFYNFNAGWDHNWPAGRDLIAWLETLRDAASPRYSHEALWTACARAMTSKRVQARLASYARTDDFLCTVFNPDSSEMHNYCTGERVPWLAS